jgi:hypothetical protein
MSKICGECNIEKDTNQYRKIKEKRAKNITEYLCSKCKECEKKRALINYYNNKEKYNIYNKKYKLDNKDKINETRRKYTSKKMENYEERLKRNIKTLLCIKLKNNKTKKSAFYLGENIENIKKWIEFNWNDGMTWENYGKYWEIDHSLPINCFDMTNDKDIKTCFSWMNLMPLSKKINLKKSSKIIVSRIIYQEIKLKEYSNKFPEIKNKIYEYINDYAYKFKSQYKN